MIGKKVSIEKLKEDMVIISDVYTKGGIIIVPSNTKVTVEVLNLLKKHSIAEVVIGEEVSNFEILPEEADLLDGALGMLNYLEEREQKQDTFEESLHVAIREVQNFFDQLLAGKNVDIYELLDIVAEVVEKADNNVNLFQMLYKRMNQQTGDIYEHCINVSLYAQLLAKWASLSADEVELAGIAGILHDIGLIVCHREGEKNISLHGEYENKCGFNHMVYSYKLIRDFDVDERLKQAILSHHERMDLSGFPNKLSYKKLNHISRAVAIADCYATLTMREDGYEAMQPLNALCYMFDNCYIKFDTEMLICFIEHIVQNFIQYEVVLSDGRRGKMVMPNKKEPARPVVMVGEEIVDLAVRKDLSITEMYY